METNKNFRNNYCWLSIAFIFSPEGGFLREPPSMGTLVLIFSGYIIYRIADGKARESDINESYTLKGYSVEEAKERTKHTITILKERNNWPNYGLDDLISASKQVNSYFMREK